MWSIQGNGKTDLGAGHFMWTTGDLWDDKVVALSTTTQSVTWFGGFTGEASILVVDRNMVALAQSEIHRFGVDGTWIGKSKRTDLWNYRFADLDLTRVYKIAPVHEWHLHFEISKAIKLGETVGPAIIALLAL